VRGRARRLVGVVALTMASALTACGGVPLDDEPRVINPESLPDALLRPPTTLSPGGDAIGVDADLFLLYSQAGVEVLVACAVPTPAGGSVEAGARSVVEGLVALDLDSTDVCPDDLTNAVPPTLEVLTVRLVVEGEGNILDLNLGKEGLSGIEATQQRRAIAQLVFTATDVPGVSAVRFYANGTAISVPLEDRTADPGEAIRPRDFPDLLEASERFAALGTGSPTTGVETAPVP
jgi:hypothetical protein